MSSFDKGIVATEKDVGRRVKLTTMGGSYGTLVDHKGCTCGQPCCYVRWANGGKVTATWQSTLAWADEQLI